MFHRYVGYHLSGRFGCCDSRSKNYGATNRMTSADWVVAIAYLSRNIPDCRQRAWCKEFLFRRPHNDIFCQVVPWPYNLPSVVFRK
jgi:hypothetical protein